MELQPVTYEHGGRPFTGYLADGSRGGQVPGVLVVHEAGGLADNTKMRASMLGELGYVAFAMDLFGATDLPMDQARLLVQQLRADLPTFRGRVRAALEVLRDHPHVDPARLAGIGYCFGGTAVLELARDGADLGCVVGFHAGLTTAAPADAKAIRAKVLVCQGADDPIITADQRDAFAAEMTAGGVDWQMIVYGGVGHSFTNRDIDTLNFPGFAYHQVADRRSWRAMLDLFDEVFGATVIPAS